jgi:hypothetical protein
MSGTAAGARISASFSREFVLNELNVAFYLQESEKKGVFMALLHAPPRLASVCRHLQSQTAPRFRGDNHTHRAIAPESSQKLSRPPLPYLDRTFPSSPSSDSPTGLADIDRFDANAAHSKRVNELPIFSDRDCDDRTRTNGE